MIKTILLDLDNTLLDFDKAEKIALVKTLTELEISSDHEVIAAYNHINEEQWQLLEQQKITREIVKVRRFSLLFEKLHIEADSNRAAERYQEYLGIGHYYIEGAEKILQEYSRQYHLYLVTNGTASVQEGRIQSASMEKYFQNIFISEKVGYDKPNRKYFDYCFSKIKNFQRNETILIGDSLTSDIQGGINAGISTVWFNPKQKKNGLDIRPDYEIQTWAELQSVLKKLN